MAPETIPPRRPSHGRLNRAVGEKRAASAAIGLVRDNSGEALVTVVGALIDRPLLLVARVVSASRGCCESGART